MNVCLIIHCNLFSLDDKDVWNLSFLHFCVCPAVVLGGLKQHSWLVGSATKAHLHSACAGMVSRLSVAAVYCVFMCLCVYMCGCVCQCVSVCRCLCLCVYVSVLVWVCVSVFSTAHVFV